MLHPLFLSHIIQVIKSFLEGKQVHVGMEASKTNQLDGNDTTLSQHPYILCRDFATACTNVLCVVVFFCSGVVCSVF